MRRLTPLERQLSWNFSFSEAMAPYQLMFLILDLKLIIAIATIIESQETQWDIDNLSDIEFVQKYGLIKGDS